MTPAQRRCDHTFPEEREPSGRLILAPCFACGLSALDAIDALRIELDQAVSEADDIRSRRRAVSSACRLMQKAIDALQPKVER